MSSTSTTFVGSLTHDPEIKFLSNTSVVKFSVAVNRKRKDEEIVSFFDCEAWGSLAENAANCLKKGDRIIVTGELKQDRYEVEGKKRSAVVVVAEAIGPDLRFATAAPQKQAAGQKPTKSEDAF